MITIEEVQQRLKTWHYAKYGNNARLVETALKGCEEMGEIAKAVLRGDKGNLKEEIADVFFILVHLARIVGTDILSLAAVKLPVIEERLRTRGR